MTRAGPFEWDASTYDRLPLPHLRWGEGVLERLAPAAGETVMDLGCGTGRDTERLLELVPDGRVVAVDGSHQMLERLRTRLSERISRVEVVHADLRAPFTYTSPVDAVMSVATFHWIPDHEVLLRSISGVLRPGGRLVAEAGGEGNIAAVRAALSELGVADEGQKWNFAAVDETVELLEEIGFVDVQTRLVDDPIRLQQGDELEAFLATVVLGPDLAELPPAERVPFVRAVAERLPDATIDYVRLQIEATHRGDS